MRIKKNQCKDEKNKVVIVLSVLTIISLIIMIVALCKSSNRVEQPIFIPPEFDANAIVGTPRPPENSGYRILYQEGMSFHVGLCGVVRVNGASADVYMMNVSENSLWLKIRIYDEKGNVLGESGIIKPGEYIQSVKLTQSLDQDANIKLKIMSYEPDTYYSGGSIIMTPEIMIG